MLLHHPGVRASAYASRIYASHSASKTYHAAEHPDLPKFDLTQRTAKCCACVRATIVQTRRLKGAEYFLGGPLALMVSVTKRPFNDASAVANARADTASVQSQADPWALPGTCPQPADGAPYWLEDSDDGHGHQARRDDPLPIDLVTPADWAPHAHCTFQHIHQETGITSARLAERGLSWMQIAES